MRSEPILDKVPQLRRDGEGGVAHELVDPLWGAYADDGRTDARIRPVQNWSASAASGTPNLPQIWCNHSTVATSFGVGAWYL